MSDVVKVPSGSKLGIGFSRAVRVGDLVFVSGCAPIAADGSVAAPGDVKGQTRRCLQIIEAALAQALRSGKLRAAWFDCLEPGWLESGRPLHGIGTLQVTPRLAGTTRESRVRAAWAVARGIDGLLTPSTRGQVPAPAADFY